MDDEKYKLNKKIDAERTDKSLTLGKFRDNTNKQLKMQHKYVEEFQKNAMIESQKLRETLENEMDDRFVSQKGAHLRMKSLIICPIVLRLSRTP